VQEEDIVVVETHIDDMNPQFYPPLIDRLLDAGAIDAFLIPILMKKGRPGMLLTVLAHPGQADSLSDLILEETTTLGVRQYPARRRILARRIVSVDTPYGAVRLKVVYPSGLARYTPEYEDCVQAARSVGVPLHRVYEAVHLAAGSLDLDRLP